MTPPRNRATPQFLPHLRKLRSSMQAQDEGRSLFRTRINNRPVEVIYLIDGPNEMLMIGIGGLLPYAFTVTVDTKGAVSPYLKEHYGPMLDALGIEYNPDNPFSTRGFFNNIDAAAPPVHTKSAKPTTKQTLKYYDDTEEPDKIYYIGWVLHGADRGVTKKNLQKTERILGWKIMQQCRYSNISSRWSDNPRDERSVPPVPKRRA